MVWSDAAGAAQSLGLLGGQGVGSGAQQLAGFGVEEAQGGVVDADADAAAAEDFGGQDDVVAQRDVSAAADGAVDLERGEDFLQTSSNEGPATRSHSRVCRQRRMNPVLCHKRGSAVSVRYAFIA